MNKRFLILILVSVLSLVASAQELQFTINIDRQEAPNIPINLATDLQTNLSNFVNNRRWTNDQFLPQERIKCNILMTLTSGSTVGTYLSVAQIQFVRPVYGATYETLIITFIDKYFNFEFAQSQSLDYNENVYLTNIASMLSFYAYIALALDYDSFSKMGGSPYIEKAFAIANTAQSAGPAPLGPDGKNGWESTEFNSRMSLIINLNNQQFVPFREGMYTYHREALDKFTENPDTARVKIIGVLQKIKTTRQTVSISILNGSFFLAKKQELIQIFSKASPEMKNQLLDLLRDLDTVNSDAYSVILKSN